MKDFAWRLILNRRYKATQKWPIDQSGHLCPSINPGQSNIHQSICLYRQYIRTYVPVYPYVSQSVHLWSVSQLVNEQLVSQLVGQLISAWSVQGFHWHFQLEGNWFSQVREIATGGTWHRRSRLSPKVSKIILTAGQFAQGLALKRNPWVLQNADNQLVNW